MRVPLIVRHPQGAKGAVANGIVELRKAVASWYQRLHGLTYTPDQVLISNGAKHSLHNALAATVGPAVWTAWLQAVLRNRMTLATEPIVKAWIPVAEALAAAKVTPPESGPA